MTKSALVSPFIGESFQIVYENNSTSEELLFFGGKAAGKSNITNTRVYIEGVPESSNLNDATTFTQEIISRYPTLINKIEVLNPDKVAGSGLIYLQRSFDSVSETDLSLNLVTGSLTGNIVEVPANLLLGTSLALGVKVKGKANAADPANQVKIKCYVGDIYNATQAVSTPLRSSDAPILNTKGGKVLFLGQINTSPVYFNDPNNPQNIPTL